MAPSGSRTVERAPAPAAPSAAAKKKEDVTAPEAATAPPIPGESRPAIPLTDDNAPALWSQAISGLTGFAAEYAKHFERIAISAPNHLAIYFRPGYTLAKSVCERPEQLAKFEQAMSELTGQTVRIEFRERETEPRTQPTAPARTVLPHQRMMQVSQHPMVRLASELFGAHVARVEEPPPSTENGESSGKSDATAFSP